MDLMDVERKLASGLVVLALLFAATSCRSGGAGAPDAPQEAEVETYETTVLETEEEQVERKETSLKMMIGDTAVKVEWEENESVAFLQDLVKDEPLTVSLSMYGGFEQVGALGTEVPRNDVQTTTQAGDIVLYSGDQIVVFYGSNSWAYTRLGHITDRTAEEMAGLLGNGDVTVTLSVE